MLGLGTPTLVASAGAAPAGPSVASTITCGQEITTDVVLTHDLDCAGTAFHVFTPDVTINLAGHTVRNTNQFEWCDTAPPIRFGGCEVTLAAENTVLRNGRLDGFTVAADANTQITRMVIEDAAIYVGGSRVHHNLIIDSTVDLGGYGAPPRLDGNWLSRSRVFLNNVNRGIGGIEVTRNIIDQSPGHGVEFQVENFGGYFPDDVWGTIADNLIVRSAGNGILVHDTTQNELALLGELAIERNTVIGSGSHGISIPSSLTGEVYVFDWETLIGGPVTITGNRAHFNGGQGIRTTTGEEPVIDGGGNRAFFNRMRPPCTGVVCTRWW
jgi:hypothetical protein